MTTKARIATVTLSALIVGGRARLVDGNGKRIAVISLEVASEASDEAMNSMLVWADWNRAFAGMLNSLHCHRIRMRVSPWETKTQTWMKSLRLRRNHRKLQYGDNSRYAEKTRPNWGAAVACLLQQYSNRLREHRLRSKNPWRLWAQTVVGNHRKKRLVYADSSIQEETKCGIGDSKAVGAETARPEVQVRIDWDRHDACSVVA